eukprot:CAMPEP_0196577230 /NCGR_PEP_ID=MMETSP1081-20130531/6332_1 /TAXON_ID=36882 /ORGANISM="Pyramimonas amylifera, Strain CCMP720" /LENGTH=135 /DNA_ID=CAMNT_0041896097 /DNA_START=1115 /DNA_END=1522 /DNA_ORIENTATION=-
MARNKSTISMTALINATAGLALAVSHASCSIADIKTANWRAALLTGQPGGRASGGAAPSGRRRDTERSVDSAEAEVSARRGLSEPPEVRLDGFEVFDPTVVEAYFKGLSSVKGFEGFGVDSSSVKLPGRRKISRA